MGKSGGGGGTSGNVEEAARITGEEAGKLNESQTEANRPNQYNPWGSTEWSKTPIWDETTGQYINQWTQVDSLNDALQGSLDAQQGLQQGRSEMAASRFDDLYNDMGEAMDFDQYGDVIGFDPDEQRQAAEDAAYQKSANRLDARFGADANQMEIDLRSKGLRPGDQAYDSAMESFGRSKNDAYEQARLGATAEGRDEFGIAQEGNAYANELRRKQIEEDLYKRGHSLDEINRLLDGQEVMGGTPAGLDQVTTGGAALKGAL